MSPLEHPKPKLVALADLSPHPRNYRDHPEDQLLHLEASIREHGFYRNVVAADDLTILAGHGVVLAALRLGIEEAPTIVLPIGPEHPQALKILAGDNEISRLAAVDSRGLSELLREIHASDELAGLLGTGYDSDDLDDRLRAAAAMGSPLDPLREWASAGMPAYEQDDKNSAYRVTVHFARAEDADSFFARLEKPKRSSMWWPEDDPHVGSDVKSKYVSED